MMRGELNLNLVAEPPHPGRRRRAAVAAAASGLLALGLACFTLLAGDGTPTVLRGVSVEEGRSLPKMGLWERADSPHHDPYYNIFSGKSQPEPAAEAAHHNWSPTTVRERVWQMMKDIKAMEKHVQQQNNLNSKLKGEITSMASSADKEKEIIRMLVQEGMSKVTDKIDLLKAAVHANVTGVKKALSEVDSTLVKRQDAQDHRLDVLESQRSNLISQTKASLARVQDKLSAAEKDLKVTKEGLAEQRGQLKKVILNKIQADIGNLDSEMRSRFNSEKDAIQAVISGGISELDRNVTNFSMTTGARIAQLVSRVVSLDDRQKSTAQRQDAALSGLESKHNWLYNHTISELEALRKGIIENRVTLSNAERILGVDEEKRKAQIAADVGPIFQAIGIKEPQQRTVVAGGQVGRGRE